MAGLVPAIHAVPQSVSLAMKHLHVSAMLRRVRKRHGVDARDKPGHDGGGAVKVLV